MCKYIYRRKVQRLKAQAIGTQEYSPPDAFLYSWSLSVYRAHVLYIQTYEVFALHLICHPPDAFLSSWCSPLLVNYSAWCFLHSLLALPHAFLHSWRFPLTLSSTRGVCRLMLSVLVNRTAWVSSLFVVVLYSWICSSWDLLPLLVTPIYARIKHCTRGSEHIRARMYTGAHLLGTRIHARAYIRARQWCAYTHTHGRCGWLDRHTWVAAALTPNKSWIHCKIWNCSYDSVLLVVSHVRVGMHVRAHRQTYWIFLHMHECTCLHIFLSFYWICALNWSKFFMFSRMQSEPI